MSNDTTQIGDGEDRMLPATWEEHQRARREAFLEGAKWTGGFIDVRDRREARDRYPITKRVPRVVTDECGIEWKVERGEVFARAPGRETWDYSIGYRFTPERVRVVADLLANPFEEVTE